MSNPANRLPPDFDDIHPTDYDPQFTADINIKMRVPDRIGLVDDDGLEERLTPVNYRHTDNNEQNMRRSMNVPERILIAGQDETVGARNDPRFELHDPTIVGESYNPVSLSTPPRNLKLDEDIYSLNGQVLEDKLAATVAQSHNGYVAATNTHHVSYDGDQEPDLLPPPTSTLPRSDVSLLTSPGGELMIHDMDDMAALRHQLERVTRHVARLEQEQEKRAQREMVLYPALIAYALFRFTQWLLRGN